MPSAPHKRRQHRGVLDDLLAVPEPAPPAAPPAASTPAGRSISARPSRTAERFTVRLPIDIIERARNTVRHTPDLTLSALTAEALTRELDRLTEQRGGAPFPTSSEPLRRGRPVR
jgi:hypothetical protein